MAPRARGVLLIALLGVLGVQIALIPAHVVAAAPTGTVTLHSVPLPPPSPLSDVEAFDLSTGQTSWNFINGFGDFYFKDNQFDGGQRFWANNVGEQGLRDATAGGDFTRYGVPVVEGHRYQVLVEPGYEGSFVVTVAEPTQVTLTFTFAAQKRIDTATACQCVDYVHRYISFGPVGEARLAGPVLESAGHAKYAPALNGPLPGIGDIIVLQPGFAGTWPAGHIGFVDDWRFDQQGRLTLWMKSANWGSNKLFTDSGCSNVSIARISPASFSAYPGGIAFYRL